MIKECLNCGYVGHVHGVATSEGVSAPYCPKCERNHKLVDPRTQNTSHNKKLSEIQKQDK